MSESPQSATDLARAERAVREAFERHDVPVLVPRRDRPYDLVVEVDGLFLRVAVTSRRGGPAAHLDERALAPREGWGDYLRGVDHVAVHDPDGDAVHLLDAAEAATEASALVASGDRLLARRLAAVAG